MVLDGVEAKGAGVNPLNEYFDAVVVLGSREHRPDRAALIAAELDKYGVAYHWFEAHWKPVNHLGKPSANLGCTSSHRSILGAICLAGWQRTLILEDDNTFIHDGWEEMFSGMIGEVPPDFDFLFLGGSFAEDPVKRISESVVQTRGMMTTSSMAVSLGLARRAAPHLTGDVGIDVLYHPYQREGRSYLFDPRLCVQRKGLSDIQGIETDGSQSMLDPHHLARLDAGEQTCI